MATVVDADGHHMETGEALARHGWSRPSSGNAIIDGMLARTSEGVAQAVCEGANPFSAESRLADMDKEHIDVSVNYPTALLLLNQLDSGAVAGELAHAYNGWAYETFTAVSGGRILTMALVNLRDPVAAVAEARRAVVELGAPGIVVSPYVGHLHLDDPSLDPLWAVAEELDVPVAVHGGRATTAPVLDGRSFRDQKRYYAMAHPFGQMVAMGDIVIGGVLDRFPRLRVAFLEAGIGWVRWYVDRLDEAAAEVRNGDTEPSVELERVPSEYVSDGRCFFSCEPDEPGLQDMVEAVGEGCVVFSSDYPHFDCSFPLSTTVLAEHLSDPALRQKVTVDNARRLYGSRVG